MDAIESGIVKVPRVPVDDDAGPTSAVTYRDLWDHIGDELPKKAPQATRRRRRPPLASAGLSSKARCESLYGTTRRRSHVGEARSSRAARRDAAGVHRRLPQHHRLQAGLRLDRRRSERDEWSRRAREPGGQLALLQQRRRRAVARTARARSSSTPRSSSPGEAMTDDFKKVAAARDRGVQGRVSPAQPRPRRRRS